MSSIIDLKNTHLLNNFCIKIFGSVLCICLCCYRTFSLHFLDKEKWEVPSFSTFLVRVYWICKVQTFFNIDDFMVKLNNVFQMSFKKLYKTFISHLPHIFTTELPKLFLILYRQNINLYSLPQYLLWYTCWTNINWMN